MRLRKYPFLWSIICFLGILTTTFAQTELLSIQQGTEADRAWALLSFNQKVQWLGVSQLDKSLLSFYLQAGPGAQDREVLSIGPDKSITVIPVNQEKNILKVEVRCADQMPLAVIRKNRRIFVWFNHDRVVSDLDLGRFGDVSYTPGRLVNVESVPGDDRLTAEMQFVGSYEWVGYVRTKPNTVMLLIKGADLNMTRKQFDFEYSGLNSIRLAQWDAEAGIIALISMNEPSYSITSRPRNMVIQTTYNQSLQKLLAEEAGSGSTEETTDTVRDTDKTVPVVLASDETAAEPGESRQEEGPDVRPVQETGDVQDEEPVSAIPWNDIVAFEFHDTPLRDALRMMARSNELNMVITDGVAGTVTMNLRNVTLRQAMNKIVHLHDCEYIIDEDIITVKPVNISYAGGRISRVYHLKYTDAENMAQVIRQVASSDTLVKVFYGEYLNGFGENSAGVNRKKANDVAVQGIRRSSTLVVTDRPEKIREIDAVIRQLDRPPVQIMIESKLVELSPQEDSEVGINWDNTLTMALQWQDILPSGNEVGYSLLDEATGEGGDWKMGKLSASQFKAVIDFLQTNTNSELISNPQLMAMDNEESSITVGTTVPVPRIQRGFGGQGDMVTFDYKEVNIQLNVTPHLSAENEITMYVNPIIEEITGWVELDRNRAPITDKRTVNSIVSVKSGETVVIGGLIKNQTVKTKKKVWLLGSLPLIGKLFQHYTTEIRKTNLLIFITPNLV